MRAGFRCEDCNVPLEGHEVRRCGECHETLCAEFDLDPSTGALRFPTDEELDASYLAERGEPS